MESVADEVKDVHYRIGKDAEFALYFIAALFDLLSFVLDILGIVLSVVGIGVVLVGINSLVGMFGELILAFLFFLKGVSPFSQKIALRYVGVFILKILPFIGGLVPAMIWTVMIVVFWSREEDKHPAIRAAEAAAARKQLPGKGEEPGKPTFKERVNERKEQNRERVEGYGNLKGTDRVTQLGRAGAKAQDVRSSAITRDDVAQELRMQRKQGVPQNFDGIQAPNAVNNNEEPAAQADAA